MIGDPESKRLKVAALNLFHPTASPLFRKPIFSYCDTVSKGGKELSLPLRKGGGEGFIFEGKDA
jgi:hypothetical protein